MDTRRETSPTVMVLGGAGFIGRHAIEALGLRPCRIVIGSRCPERLDERLPRALRCCARRQVCLERLLDAADWHEALEGVDIVVNCVGILRQRGAATYERVHHLAPVALARACRARGIRLIHVSALGLDAPAKSRFLKSKRAGEAALRESGADWHIVRPSLLDGEGGYGAKWIRRVARWPVHPVPADAAGRLAVLDVRDLGEALARVALGLPATGKDFASGREHDVGGGHARTLGEHLLALRRLHTERPAWRLPIPAWLARLASHACDLLHVTPYSYGHWELLRRDNVPRRNHLPGLLGREPRPVGLDALTDIEALPSDRCASLGVPE
jgi:uncharacterized protein YbjT (DUF2867 family)